MQRARGLLHLLMTLSKAFTFEVSNLLIALVVANAALRATELSSASIYFPLSPETAFSYGRDVLARRRRVRTVKRDDSVSFVTAEKSKEEDNEEDEEGAEDRTGEAEDIDESPQLEKGRSSEKGEEEDEDLPERKEGEEEETRSEAGESVTAEKPQEKEQEDEEGEQIAKVEDAYISQKLPEPSVGLADAQEACDSMHCAKVVAGAAPKAKITGCSRTIKCEACHSKLDPEERCTTWKPPSRATITLATGWSVTKVRLFPGSALNLPIKWDTQDEFDDEKCLPDTKQVGYAYDKLNQTGNVEKFPFTRVLNVQLAIHSIPIEGAKESKRTPQMVYSIDVADPFSWNEVVSGRESRPFSPRCHQSLQTLPDVQLRGESAAFGVGWFSVVKDKAHKLSPTNVGVRVQCTGTKSCNMKKYAVCLRVTCPPTAASAERQMAASVDAMKKPVGNTTSSITEGTGPGGAPDGGEADSYATVPPNFNVWAYSQPAGWPYAWMSSQPRTAALFNLTQTFLTLLSAAVGVA